MPKQKRISTRYPGVYYIIGLSLASHKPEKIFYIRYRKSGRTVEEKAGRQFQDDMTPAKASRLRGQRIEGKEFSNKQKRLKAEESLRKWTIDSLWAEYKTHRSNDSSFKTDDNRYQNYVHPTLGDREPSSLIPLDLDRIRIKLLKSKSPQTVKHILGLIKRTINFGRDKGLTDDIHFKIIMPNVDNKKTEDLNPDQLSRLLKAINEDENTQVATLMKLALFTGMRRGELFKLKWTDIDFNRGFIFIRNPKGKKDQHIPMNNKSRELLSNHERSGSLYVFPGRNGGQRVSASKGLNRIKARAKLPKDFRPLHGLRHTYASMLASSGKVDMYTLQKLLTHKTPTMTQRYAHLRDEAMQKASKIADDIFDDTLKSGEK